MTKFLPLEHLVLPDEEQDVTDESHVGVETKMISIPSIPRVKSRGLRIKLQFRLELKDMASMQRPGFLQ